MAKTEPEPEQPPELGEVTAEEDWRIERFMELGFGPTTSWMLAMVGADWHEAKRLLGLGCTHAYVAGEFIEFL